MKMPASWRWSSGFVPSFAATARLARYTACRKHARMHVYQTWRIARRCETHDAARFELAKPLLGLVARRIVCEPDKAQEGKRRFPQHQTQSQATQQRLTHRPRRSECWADVDKLLSHSPRALQTSRERGVTDDVVQRAQRLPAHARFRLRASLMLGLRNLREHSFNDLQAFCAIAPHSRRTPRVTAVQAATRPSSPA